MQFIKALLNNSMVILARQGEIFMIEQLVKLGANNYDAAINAAIESENRHTADWIVELEQTGKLSSIFIRLARSIKW